MHLGGKKTPTIILEGIAYARRKIEKFTREGKRIKKKKYISVNRYVLHNR